MSSDHVPTLGSLATTWTWSGFSRARSSGSGRWGPLALWGIISWLRNTAEALISGFSGTTETTEWQCPIKITVPVDPRLDNSQEENQLSISIKRKDNEYLDLQENIWYAIEWVIGLKSICRFLLLAHAFYLTRLCFLRELSELLVDFPGLFPFESQNICFLEIIKIKICLSLLLLLHLAYWNNIMKQFGFL